MPDLTGKTFVVTGGNSGLGYETAVALAERGAHVVVACRDVDKGRHAAEQVRERCAGEVSVEVMALDLASLASVRAFAEAFAARHDRLDGLCNNAGVMAAPWQETQDGFELQIGVNHLGHFALTNLLVGVLRRTSGARVVTVTSYVHHAGRINLADLNGRESYSRWGAYAQSKLANVLFTLELHRRFTEEGAGVRALAAHPGYAATNLQEASARLQGSVFTERFFGVTNRYFAQSAEMGALPTLYAATSPDALPGALIGPHGFLETSGYPRVVKPSRRGRDATTAARLWDASEQLTGVRYPQ